MQGEKLASFLENLVINDLGGHIFAEVFTKDVLKVIGLASLICQLISGYLSFEESGLFSSS